MFKSTSIASTSRKWTSLNTFALGIKRLSYSVDAASALLRLLPTLPIPGLGWRLVRHASPVVGGFRVRLAQPPALSCIS